MSLWTDAPVINTVRGMVARSRDNSLSNGWDRRAFYVRAAWLAAVIGLAVADLRAWLVAASLGWGVPWPPGADFDTYRDAGAHFLAGAGFYHPYQLAGPYDVWFNPIADPILYPPTMAPLFAAFTFLPSFLYWLIPLGIIGAVIAYHRPRPLALATIALLLAWPTGLVWLAWFGNPTMWIVAIMALATVRPGFAPFVLLKPTVAPLALWGVRHRSWWVGLLVFVLVSLPFALLWLDYARALLNSRQEGGLLYGIWNSTAMLLPVIAWAGRAVTLRRWRCRPEPRSKD